MQKMISPNILADLLGVSRMTVSKWIESGKIRLAEKSSGEKGVDISSLKDFPEVYCMASTQWNEELDTVPLRVFSSVELFAGGGGLALGMETAGFRHVLLNEFDHDACETLRHNRPGWNIIEGDIHNVDFSPYRDAVDFISGGFPCQAFSYAGKRLGFEETRGTLFFELARAVKEIRPKVFMCENVKGLLEHDGGRTLNTIKGVIRELGYSLVEPRVLKALNYDVPQKRERLILIAIRDDIAPFVQFRWPEVSPTVRTLRDAFYAGSLYSVDVPRSEISRSETQSNGTSSRRWRLARLARRNCERLYERQFWASGWKNRHGAASCHGRTEPYAYMCSGTKTDRKMPSIGNETFDSEGVCPDTDFS